MSSLSTVAGAAALGAYATVRHGRPLRRAGRAGEVQRIAVRRMKAVAFRLQGATFRQIGAALDCSAATAHEDVTAELMAVCWPPRARY
ncbi:MAG: hypothetical protein IH939_13260 [Acidobacteria bacterium]|nr:hypothetical protein [Acidobacteriota bacterium]